MALIGWFLLQASAREVQVGTATSRLAGLTVLADELLALVPGGAGFEVHGTPAQQLLGAVYATERLAAGAQPAPPVEQLRGLRADDRQPLGHAARDLAMQPGRLVGAGEIGPITARLAAHFTAVVRGRVEHRRSWLTPVWV